MTYEKIYAEICRKREVAKKRSSVAVKNNWRDRCNYESMKVDLCDEILALLKDLYNA